MRLMIPSKRILCLVALKKSCRKVCSNVAMALTSFRMIVEVFHSRLIVVTCCFVLILGETAVKKPYPLN